MCIGYLFMKCIYSFSIQETPQQHVTLRRKKVKVMAVEQCDAAAAVQRRFINRGKRTIHTVYGGSMKVR